MDPWRSKQSAALSGKDETDLSNRPSENPKIFWDGYGLSQPASGVYVYAQSLAGELVKLGTKPTVVTGMALNLEAVDYLKQARGIFSSQFAHSKVLEPICTKRAILSKKKGPFLSKKPAILHGLSNINLPVTGVDKRRLKLVLTVHDLIPLLVPNCTSRSYYLQFAALLPRVTALADAVVCVSEWTKRSLLQRHPHLEAKTVVIKNGRSIPLILPVTKKNSDKTPKKPTILYVARHETYKRIDFFIEILKAAQASVSGILVTNLAGQAFAAKRAAGLELKTYAEVSQQQIAKIYEAADVYVHPSLFEGFGLPILEAFQTGLPVVYLTGSAVDEIVRPQVAIGLDQKANAQAWVREIERAVNLSRHDSFLDNVHKHLESLPTWKDAAVRLQTLYNSLCE